MILKRLIVIGAGAVGGSVGGVLAHAGLPVFLVARGEHGHTIGQQGLHIRLPERDFTVRASCVQRIDEIEWADGDMAMFATKSQDAQEAMDELLRVGGQNIPVVCASNGVQVEIWAAKRFATALSMLVWLPAVHLVPGKVALFATGSIGVLDVGPVCGDAASACAKELCRWLNQGGFDSIYRDDIKKWKYAKWITNLGNTAQALIADDWKPVAAAAKAEGKAVFAKAGIEHVTMQELHERTQKVQLARIAGEDRRGGSTWQSRVRHKSLETPWIEGAIVALAEQVGVPAPVNRLLAEAAQQSRALTTKEFTPLVAQGTLR